MLSFLAGMNQKDFSAFYTVVHTPVVCNDRCLGLRGAENCGFSAVAAHFQGRRLPCRTAEAHPHDQAVQQTIVIPLLPYTRWSMSLCTGRADFLRGAEASSMVQTVCLTMDIPSCSTRWPMSLLSWSCRFTSSSWRRGRFLMVRPVWQTIEISQLQYAPGGQCSC